MSEVFIPPEAIEAARYALGCVYEPSASNLDDRIPSLNTAYERRFSPAVWRAAIKRVLDSGEVGNAGRSSLDDHRLLPKMRFFRDVESGNPVAILASRVEDMTTEDRAYLREIEPSHLDQATVDRLISAAIDEEVRRSGL
ncbi:hypothetical protein AH2_00029 [Burkholderia phage vB_BceS_AH2]|uniref:Uncharacterized protein n=1 Tax=Burkholderia phage vB_BceS_AH2 TaxID=1133022 RepID=I6NTL7_9CAUD|nr:hypothetical protein B613_gp29 [Burkholderia phage vB_BceS_AH2]AEY69539.1 hypothetical protein AH2_00029 [Burkholderia phage vB_BceS_AH2]